MIMSGKVFIHQEEEGKHLFRDKDDDSLFHGVQGDDDTNRVAGDAKFRGYDKDEFIHDELRKDGKIAIDEDELDRLRDRDEEFGGLNPEEQALAEFLGEMLATFAIRVGAYVGDKAIQWFKPHVKKASIELRYKLSEWKRNNSDADFQNVLLNDLNTAMQKVKEYPEDVIYRRNFQRIYFQTIAFAQTVGKRDLKKWKRKLKSINQDDWNAAVELCINDYCGLISTDEVLLLEDRALMRRLEKENELLQSGEAKSKVK